MLHWKITNRAFALWRCQELTKLNNYNSRAQGMWTQLRPSISKLQELLDVQIPCSWSRDPAKLRERKGLTAPFGQYNHHTHHPQNQYQSFSTACTSSGSSSTLSQQNLSGGKFVFPPICEQEKPWSRRFVQSRCDASTHHQQIHEEFKTSPKKIPKM